MNVESDKNIKNGPTIQEPTNIYPKYFPYQSADAIENLLQTYDTKTAATIREFLNNPIKDTNYQRARENLVAILGKRPTEEELKNFLNNLLAVKAHDSFSSSDLKTNISATFPQEKTQAQADDASALKYVTKDLGDKLKEYNKIKKQLNEKKQELSQQQKKTFDIKNKISSLKDKRDKFLTNAAKHKRKKIEQKIHELGHKLQNKDNYMQELTSKIEKLQTQEQKLKAQISTLQSEQENFQRSRMQIKEPHKPAIIPNTSHQKTTNDYVALPTKLSTPNNHDQDRAIPNEYATLPMKKTSEPQALHLDLTNNDYVNHRRDNANTHNDVHNAHLNAHQEPTENNRQSIRSSTSETDDQNLHYYSKINKNNNNPFLAENDRESGLYRSLSTASNRSSSSTSSTIYEPVNISNDTQYENSTSEDEEELDRIIAQQKQQETIEKKQEIVENLHETLQELQNLGKKLEDRQLKHVEQLDSFSEEEEAAKIHDLQFNVNGELANNQSKFEAILELINTEQSSEKKEAYKILRNIYGHRINVDTIDNIRFQCKKDIESLEYCLQYMQNNPSLLTKDNSLHFQKRIAFVKDRIELYQQAEKMASFDIPNSAITYIISELAEQHRKEDEYLFPNAKTPSSLTSQERRNLVIANVERKKLAITKKTNEGRDSLQRKKIKLAELHTKAAQLEAQLKAKNDKLDDNNKEFWQSKKALQKKRKQQVNSLQEQKGLIDGEISIIEQDISNITQEINELEKSVEDAIKKYPQNSLAYSELLPPLPFAEQNQQIPIENNGAITLDFNTINASKKKISASLSFGDTKPTTTSTTDSKKHTSSATTSAKGSLNTQKVSASASTSKVKVDHATIERSVDIHEYYHKLYTYNPKLAELVAMQEELSLSAILFSEEQLPPKKNTSLFNGKTKEEKAAHKKRQKMFERAQFVFCHAPREEKSSATELSMLNAELGWHRIMQFVKSYFGLNISRRHAYILRQLKEEAPKITTFYDAEDRFRSYAKGTCIVIVMIFFSPIILLALGIKTLGMLAFSKVPLAKEVYYFKRSRKNAQENNRKGKIAENNNLPDDEKQLLMFYVMQGILHKEIGDEFIKFEKAPQREKYQLFDKKFDPKYQHKIHPDFSLPAKAELKKFLDKLTMDNQKIEVDSKEYYLGLRSALHKAVVAQDEYMIDLATNDAADITRKSSVLGKAMAARNVLAELLRMSTLLCIRNDIPLNDIKDKEKADLELGDESLEFDPNFEADDNELSVSNENPGEKSSDKPKNKGLKKKFSKLFGKKHKEGPEEGPTR